MIEYVKCPVKDYPSEQAQQKWRWRPRGTWLSQITMEINMSLGSHTVVSSPAILLLRKRAFVRLTMHRAWMFLSHEYSFSSSIGPHVQSSSFSSHLLLAKRLWPAPIVANFPQAQNYHYSRSAKWLCRSRLRKYGSPNRNLETENVLRLPCANLLLIDFHTSFKVIIPFFGYPVTLYWKKE